MALSDAADHGVLVTELATLPARPEDGGPAGADVPRASTTALLATIQPYPDALERVEYGASRGVAAFRVNFARHPAEANLQLLRSMGEWAERRGLPLERWVDLPGSKPRLGRFAEGSEVLQPGQPFTLLRDPSRPGDASCVGTAMGEAFDGLACGDQVVLADGAVVLAVERRDGESVRCTVVRAGRVHSRAGAIVPSRYVPSRALTVQDHEVVRLAAPFATHVCVSFADTRTIVADARAAAGTAPKIVAKIESPAGVAELAGMAEAADGLVLARGDLGAFFEPAAMREIGVRLVRAARGGGAAAVLATNFFQGVAQSGRLTAAEADDLRWAFSLRPEYLMINETSHSPRWREVFDTAAEACRRLAPPL